MNRVIKFRGKSVVDKKWVYGSFVLCTHNAIADICDIVVDNDDITQTPVLSYTVGQFVGLHDENGKEIYEGDIVEIFNPCAANSLHPIAEDVHNCGVVKWENDCSRFIVDCVNDARGRNFDLLPRFEFTVIGNIHDNPKLIKKKF